MKPFAAETMCKECPFRRGGTGIRLARARVREITHGLLSNPGATFACHKYTRAGGSKTPDNRHCRGALAFMEKHNTATQMARIAERLGMYDPRAIVEDVQLNADTFDTTAEMAAAGLDRRKKKVNPHRGSSVDDFLKEE